MAATAAAMVNHALTSPPLWCRAFCGGRFHRPVVESRSRYDPPSVTFRPHPARPKAGRRLCGCTSCWPTSQPGKPAINLSVGEPQHPIPPFVGSMLQAHLNDFGRYPANKGTDASAAPPPPG